MAIQLCSEDSKRALRLALGKQAPGAYPVGTRVEKTWEEEGDLTPLGTKGVVLGSAGPAPNGMLAYLVQWDTMPDCFVFVISAKIKELKWTTSGSV